MHCNTNWRRINCYTNWRCSARLFEKYVVAGFSGILPTLVARIAGPTSGLSLAILGQSQGEATQGTSQEGPS